MMDAGLSGKVATADTKPYSGPSRGAGAGGASSSKGFSDELSKASSQKNAYSDDQEIAIDSDEQDAADLLAEDGASNEVSEDAAGGVKTGGKVKPIIDISAAGLRRTEDSSVSNVALNATVAADTDLETPDSDAVATETSNAAKIDKAEQLAKAALGALSESTAALTADETAALQHVARTGLGQRVDIKASADPEDTGKDADISEEDLESVLSLLGGNPTAGAEQVDSDLAEAMADSASLSKQAADDTDATETTSISVGAAAEGKTTAKTSAASTPASGNAVAHETVSSDQAFRAVRADGTYETAAVSARRDDAAGVETKAAATDNLPTVTVIDSRRYLAPAETSNAANIAASMMGDSEWVSAMRAGAEVTDTPIANGRVLNTLKIQMSPIDLGNVTATLRLTGDELTVSLVVESSAAYRKLSEDQNEIVKTLRAQGFSVDQVQITIVSSDKAANDSSQSGGQFSGQQSAQNGGQGGATNNRSQDTFSSSLGNDQSLGVLSDEASASQSSLGSTRSGQLYL